MRAYLTVMEKPKCPCHGETMRWHKDARMKAGGHWLCAVKAREFSRTYHEILVQQARDLLGNVCAECGSTDGPFDVDHINGDGAEHRAQFGGWTHAYYRDVIRSIEAGEGRVQLLCEDPCHKDKTREERKAKVLA